MRYRAFADELRLKYTADVPTSISLVFSIRMPDSWSTKKKDLMRSQPHQQKPDIDNLVKAVLDALLDKDEAVWRLDASKIWGDSGSILIEPYDL